MDNVRNSKSSTLNMFAKNLKGFDDDEQLVRASVRPNFTQFLGELAKSKGLVNWLSTLGDFHQEVDVLKSKVRGDLRLINLLGDLDSVCGWISKFGILGNNR